MRALEGRVVERLDPEKVAYWYFRLNGCLTMVNFVLHPPGRGSQRTDADVLAVRFPHRSELADTARPLVDDTPFRGSTGIELAVAEVKTGPCGLNDSWTVLTSFHRVKENLSVEKICFATTNASKIETSEVAMRSGFLKPCPPISIRRRRTACQLRNFVQAAGRCL